MPARTEKQLNYFRLVKAYKDGGYPELFATWEEIYPTRDYPFRDWINKLVKVAKSLKDEYLEDLISDASLDYPSFEGVMADDMAMEHKIKTTIEQVISELFMHKGQAVPEAPSHTAEVLGRGQAVKVIMFDMVTQYGIINKAFYKRKKLWYEVDMIFGENAGDTIEVPANEVFKNHSK